MCRVGVSRLSAGFITSSWLKTCLFPILDRFWWLPDVKVMWKLCENFHIIQLQLWPISNDYFESSPVLIMNSCCMMLRKRYYHWFKCFPGLEVRSNREIVIWTPVLFLDFVLLSQFSLFFVVFEGKRMWKLCENFHIIQLQLWPISNHDFDSYREFYLNSCSMMLSDR